MVYRKTSVDEYAVKIGAFGIILKMRISLDEQGDNYGSVRNVDINKNDYAEKTYW